MNIYEKCLIALDKTFPESVLSKEEKRDIANKMKSFASNKTDFNIHLERLKKATDEQLMWIQKEQIEQKKMEAKKIGEITTAIKNDKDPNDVILEYLTPGVGADSNQLSIDIMTASTRNMYKNVLLQDGVSQGVPVKQMITTLNDPQFTKPILKALHGLNNGTNLSGFPLDIVAAAKSIRKVQRLMMENLRKSGIDIKDRNDYLVRQTHDAAKIMGVSKNDWVSFIELKLDPERTFDDVLDRQSRLKILGDIYDDIRLGQYSGIGTTGLGKSRSLHFNSPDDFADYSMRFGKDSLYQTVMDTLNAGAKTESLRRTLGPRPMVTLEKVISETEKILSKKPDGGKALEKFRSTNMFADKWKRDNIIRMVTGQQHPGETTLGKGLDILKNIQVESKLGSAFLTTGTDLPISTATMMAKTGMAGMDAQWKLMKEWGKNLSPAHRKKFAALMALDAHSTIDRISGDEANLHSAMGKFHNAVMKLTLLDATTKINRTTLATVFSSHLADQSDKKFHQLDPRLRATFKNFQIGEKEWDVLSKQTEDIDGNLYISPAKLMENNVDRAIVQKFAAMAYKIGENGAIGPDTRTRLITTMGAHPESVQAKFLSHLFLFKSYSLRVAPAINDIIKSNPNANNATFLSALKNYDNKKILGGLMLGSYATTQMGMWAKDMLKGKDPEDPLSFDNVTQVVQRGVMPIWGDWVAETMSGGYAKYNRSWVTDIMGPSFQTVNDTIRFTSKAADDIRKKQQLSGDTVGLGITLLKRNTPGIYAPGLGPFMQSLLYDNLAEWNNPGFKERLNLKKMNSNNVIEW